MAALTFSQPARRNLLAPVAIAVIFIVVAVALVILFTPHTTADIAVTHTAVYAAHTVYKSDSIVVGSDPSQDDLYVLATVRIADRLRLPLFLKDFTATLTPTNPDGSPGEPVTTSAPEKTDLPNLYITFPALKTLTDEEAKAPLYRETQINPGQSVEGVILLHFNASKAIWDHRTSATMNIDLYHQGPVTVTIPKS